MKKGLKRFALILSLSLAALAAGCNVKEDVETFVEQLTCAHEYGAGEITKAATCTEKGELSFTCEDCGVIKTEAIELIEHKPQTVGYRAPTCKAPGHNEYKQCQICGDMLTQKVDIPALGHTVLTTEAIMPTCSNYGWTVGKRCSTCGDTLENSVRIDKLEHTDINSDCLCDVCDDPCFPNNTQLTFEDIKTGDVLSGWYRIGSIDDGCDFSYTAAHATIGGEEVTFDGSSEITISCGWNNAMYCVEGSMKYNPKLLTDSKDYGQVSLVGPYSGPTAVVYEGDVFVYIDDSAGITFMGDGGEFINVLITGFTFNSGSRIAQKAVFNPIE